MVEVESILAFAQKYGVELIIGLWLLVKVVNNAGKIADKLAKLSPPLSKWLEAQREEKKQDRIEKEVITSAQLSAKIEQDQAALHHEFDSEAVNQAHQMRQSVELLGILKETLKNFWESDKKRDEQWERVYSSLLRMESTLSLHTQTIAYQADAYANLECVKNGRLIERRRKTNGD